MIEEKTKIINRDYLKTSKSLALPKTIINDSTFPFDEDDDLIIKIVGETLVISREGTN